MSAAGTLRLHAGETVRNLLQTAFRMAPWPTESGLRLSGEPGEFSPVIVTSNYDLTVRRVLRALRGVDAWVVVAPASGINVWCAAAGGHLTTHQVVTALKTSGVEQRVRHRRAILPPLAATGVLAREVSRRCGWRTHFGPVYAEDLPRYLEQDGKKSEDMRRVRFGLSERLEMAAAWGIPAAIVVAGGAALIRPAWSGPLALLAILLSIAVFTLYDRIPGPRTVLLALAAAAVAAAAVVAFGGGTPAVTTAAVAGVALSALLTYDYTGSTPIEGGSHFEERAWHIVLDTERCKGLFTCWEVCPEACFEKPAAGSKGDARRIRLAHDERCIRCGACIVQCGMDALHFEDQHGGRVDPDVIRRFKLNLLGRRAVQADVDAPPGSPEA